MPSGSAGRRYAHAIFDIAREQNKLEQWAADLDTIAYTFNAPNVQPFLANPKSSHDQKALFVKNVLESKVGPEALNLAQMLVTRDRQTFGDAINVEFTKLWNQLRGIEVAEVTTAIPVSQHEQDQIKANLIARTGKQITLNMLVDPEIIGGLVARVGDTLIDGSVRTRLQNLRKQLA